MLLTPFKNYLPYASLYRWGIPKVLPLNYTFSLTFACQSRCGTCNVWRKKVSPSGELTLGEWSRVFQSLGHSPFWVTLSGGEPFLRRDLPQLIKNLTETCCPEIINIPTNCLLGEKIAEITEKTFKESPKIKNLTVNLSLDGVGGDHDKIRGVPGNFEKVIIVFNRLKDLKERFPTLTIGIHSVISKLNVGKALPLFDFVLSELKPDSYVTEIAEERVELGTVKADITPPLRDYARVIDSLQEKLKKYPEVGVSKITRAFRSEYYRLVKDYLDEPRQVVPCLAGVASAQIAPNGDVWECCVRADILGNLREVGFDFKKVWFSPKADAIRRSVKNCECACPLANVSYTNFFYHPFSLIRVIRDLI